MGGAFDGIEEIVKRLGESYRFWQNNMRLTKIVYMQEIIAEDICTGIILMEAAHEKRNQDSSCA